MSHFHLTEAEKNEIESIIKSNIILDPNHETMEIVITFIWHDEIQKFIEKKVKEEKKICYCSGYMDWKKEINT